MDKIKKSVDHATNKIVANEGAVQYLRTQNYYIFASDLLTLNTQADARSVGGIAIPVWI